MEIGDIGDQLADNTRRLIIFPEALPLPYGNRHSWNVSTWLGSRRNAPICWKCFLYKWEVRLINAQIAPNFVH